MFTGIVECLGSVVAIEKEQENISLWIRSDISSELKIDQSVSHNGICLTIDALNNGMHRVTAIQETILKTTISDFQIHDRINLERCLTLNQRIDGHIVQGHIDSTGQIVQVENLEGSYNYTISYDQEFQSLIIEKGSICLDGISLTAHSLNSNELKVSIIPYTYSHTNASQWKQGDRVNLEFDIIGKYMQRMISTATDNRSAHT